MITNLYFCFSESGNQVDVKLQSTQIISDVADVINSYFNNPSPGYIILNISPEKGIKGGPFPLLILTVENYQSDVAVLELLLKKVAEYDDECIVDMFGRKPNTKRPVLLFSNSYYLSAC